MRFVSKLGVLSLALVLFAGPALMACLVPTARLTAAEQECCKQMAGQCGKAGMDKSHFCCQKLATPDDLNFVKAKTSHVGPELRTAALFVPTVALPVAAAQVSLIPSGAGNHGPPESPPTTVSVLRI